MDTSLTKPGRWICIVAVALLAGRTARGDETGDVREQLRLLQRQSQQQQLIETLTKKVSKVEAASRQREGEMQTLKSAVENQPTPVAESSAPFSLGKVMLSGEGGLVLENRYFTLTDTHNRFVIPDVPAGTYKLEAWHERLPPAIQEITVPEKGNVKVDFTLGITGLPEY